MNTKKILSAMLGGVLLASCSVDDGFNDSPEASANPYSPVLSVTFDNTEGTRAEYTDEKNKVIFNHGDLLSMYHGVDLWDNGGAIVDDNNFLKYESAIYEGINENEEGFKFTTRALVQPGAALVMYPADIEFLNNKSQSPMFEIETELQDAGYREKTPYMSNIIDIAEYHKDATDKSQMAGFGDRNYNIALKRVGGMLRLGFEFENKPEDMTVEVESVEISGKIKPSSGDAFPMFTKRIAVKAGDAYNVTNAGGTAINTTWKNVSKVDFLDEESAYVKTITSKDLYVTTADMHGMGTTVCAFTLLPFKGANDENGALSQGFELTDVEMVVHTTLGPVKIKGDEVFGTWETVGTEDEAEKKWVYKSVQAGLQETFGGMYKQRPTSANFPDDLQPGASTRVVKVDLSQIDMSAVHVKDQDDLIEKYALMQDLNVELDENGNSNNWYLDVQADGTFTITKPEAYVALKALMTRRATNTTTPVAIVTVCASHVANDNLDEDVERRIVLTNTAATAAIEAVNTLSNGTDDCTWLKFGSKTKVELAGTWTIGKVQATNIESITVAKGATANFTAVVDAGSGVTIINKGTINTASTGSEIGSVVENAKGATINVYGENNVKAAMTNHGTIDVKDKAIIRMYAELKNEITVPNNADLSTIAAVDALERGLITVGKEAKITSADGYGEINNYGKIEPDATAIVQINDNGKGSADYKQACSATNVLGIIDCKKGTLSDFSSITGKEGIVKTTNSANVNGYLVNYLQLEDATEIPEDLGGVKFLDVTAKSTNILAKNNASLDAIIIRKGTVYFRKEQQLRANKLYMEGWINYVLKPTTNTPKNDSTTEYVEIGDEDFLSYFGGQELTDADAGKLFHMEASK